MRKPLVKKKKKHVKLEMPIRHKIRKTQAEINRSGVQVRSTM